MSMMETPSLELLERFLNLASFRQALISANIANIDTPGYKTQDIDFHNELLRVVNSPDSSQQAPFVEQVQGLISRPDGNNVSIDRESLLLSKTQLQFSVAIQIMRAEFQKLNEAITGGGGFV
jgi:flagellar basal-body rod protein FlgB